MQREAIRILMQSPIYFRMSLAERKILIREFCVFYGGLQLSPHVR